MNDFENYLKLYQKHILNFYERVKKYVEKYMLGCELYRDFLRNFKEHEVNTLIEYIENKDEKKLIFANEEISEIIKKNFDYYLYKNDPYRSVTDWLEDEQSDIEAMIEALNSLKELENTKNLLKQKLQKINNDLEGWGIALKKTIGKMLQYEVSAENELKKEKINTEVDIQNLDEIIKMAAFNMEWIIERFKKEKTYEYFRHLKIFGNIKKENNATLNKFWKLVVRNINELEKNE